MTKAGEHTSDPFESENDPSGFERIKALINRAEKLGVCVRYAVVLSEGKAIANHSQDQLFAASLGKLPLAHMAISLLSSGATVDIQKDFIDSAGGGALDRVGQSGLVTVDVLLDDMLRNSGNTAYRVLADYMGGPEALRAYYEIHWKKTSVHSAANGRAQIGETTAYEAYSQLHSLLTDTSGDESLRNVAIDALSHNTVTNHGIRQFVAPSSTVRIFNKTGEYNGDATDPQNYRHDTGYIRGDRGDVGYAIMTTSSARSRGIIANMTVAQFGAELARKVGGKDTASLGSRAMRLAYR
jgi:hypothetical protein